ncbi:hypothetical protein RA280_22720 [Cupriavidus sp. CV2]|uniref:hypothetical protein n=1 Tax=Cupriavidus ulmosensis TaxID=3065913 RepID=UPI00296B055C|nr:hypothetical protein [Cupriavidus sp. CV2]MDW3684508.1 hypothetical protein [Cupriavidus sp. CV2]
MSSSHFGRIDVPMVLMALLLTGHALRGTAAMAPTCPQFTDVSLSAPLTRGDRAASFPGGIVAYVRTLHVDADGASSAYHPDDIGVDLLCNGLEPFDGKRCVPVKPDGEAACRDAVHAAQFVQWKRAASPTFCMFGFEAPSETLAPNSKHKHLWGGKYGGGELPLQQSDEPAPGFFRSTTSASLPPLKRGGPRRYVQADVIPFIVMPTSYLAGDNRAVTRGAAGIVSVRQGHWVPAIVGDARNIEAMGEVSIAAAQLILSPRQSRPVVPTAEQLRKGEKLPAPYNKKSDGTVRANQNPDDGPYLVFSFGARYGRVSDFALESIRTLSTAAFDKFGGAQAIAQCARDHFER